MFTTDKQVIPGASISDLRAPIEQYKGPKGGWFAAVVLEMQRSMGVLGYKNITGRELGWALNADGQFESVREKLCWRPVNWDGGLPNGKRLAEIIDVNYDVSS